MEQVYAVVTFIPYEGEIVKYVPTYGEALASARAEPWHEVGIAGVSLEGGPALVAERLTEVISDAWGNRMTADEWQDIVLLTA